MAPLQPPHSFESLDNLPKLVNPFAIESQNDHQDDVTEKPGEQHTYPDNGINLQFDNINVRAQISPYAHQKHDYHKRDTHADTPTEPHCVLPCRFIYQHTAGSQVSRGDV